MWKKKKTTSGDKAMSNSVLYHTFGVSGVQYTKAVF